MVTCRVTCPVTCRRRSSRKRAPGQRRMIPGTGTGRRCCWRWRWRRGCTTCGWRTSRGAPSGGKSPWTVPQCTATWSDGRPRRRGRRTGFARGIPWARAGCSGGDRGAIGSLLPTISCAGRTAVTSRTCSRCAGAGRRRTCPPSSRGGSPGSPTRSRRWEPRWSFDPRRCGAPARRIGSETCGSSCSRPWYPVTASSPSSSEARDPWPTRRSRASCARRSTPTRRPRLEPCGTRQSPSSGTAAWDDPPRNDSRGTMIRP
mmetsp:Transcript_8618/g.34838  ORF Transcript_8618/g.34838 Transcript_8618/m.34838 type:complete len:259 (-) Transcript_8618:830-1606(-)